VCRFSRHSAFIYLILSYERTTVAGHVGGDGGGATKDAGSDDVCVCVCARTYICIRVVLAVAGPEKRGRDLTIQDIRVNTRDVCVCVCKHGRGGQVSGKGLYTVESNKSNDIRAALAAERRKRELVVTVHSLLPPRVSLP